MITSIRNKLLRNLYYRYKIFISHFSYTHGKENKVKLHGVNVGSKIQISGNNNTIVIEKGVMLLKANILVIGNNNTITIKQDSYLEGSEVHVEDNHCKVFIGEKSFIGLSHLAITEDNSELYIGDSCMISSHVQIRTGDSHSIIDEKGIRINRAESIRISNMVWLGEGCKIMKGVSLNDNTIVSAGAIVTKSFGPNVLIGGVPAKILKENVNWYHTRI